MFSPLIGVTVYVTLRIIAIRRERKRILFEIEQYTKMGD
jgi:hypothetical protein